MAAQVRAKDVNNTQVVELITAGRSGDIGLQPSGAVAGAGSGMSTTRRRRVSQFDLETAARSGRHRRRPRASTGTSVKGGDLGSLPAILGLVVLVDRVRRRCKADTFLTASNFANLINQGAAIMVLAMGLVFVLLLGEIDLSAGFTAGTGAAILAVTLTEHDWAWPLAVLRRAARPAWSSAC